MDTVGDNMKILEISGGKALEREEKLVDKILSLQAKYKTAEARYGKLQKSFLLMAVPFKPFLRLPNHR